MILGNDTLCVKVCIGNVALEPVPLAVLSYLLFANDNIYILADFKKFVVTTPVHLILRNASAPVGFSQPGNATVTVVSILLSTFVGIADDKSLFILTLVVVVSLVYLLQRENPLLHACTLAPDVGCEDVLVTCLLQQSDIVLVHQA